MIVCLDPPIEIFLYSHYLFAWFCIVIVRRNSVMVWENRKLLIIDNYLWWYSCLISFFAKLGNVNKFLLLFLTTLKSWCLTEIPRGAFPQIPLVSCAFGTYHRGYCTTITHIFSYALPRKKIPDAAPGEESNYLMIYAFLSEKSVKCQVLSSLCLKNKKIIRNKFIGVNTICVFVN